MGSYFSCVPSQAFLVMVLVVKMLLFLVHYTKKHRGLILFEHRISCEENSAWISNSELICKTHREKSVFQHLQSLLWTCVVSGYGTH